MKKIISTILSLSTLVLLNQSIAHGHEIHTKDLAANYEFNISSKISKEENYVYSPYSLKTAMIMAANGAQGKTQEEILNAFEIADIDSYNQYAKNVIDNLNKTGIINISNSIWFNTQRLNTPAVRFNKNYSKKLNKFYNAESNIVNYTNAVKSINNWVKEKTNKKIPKVIDSSDFLATLINTVYLNAKWQKPFQSKQTLLGTFINAKGDEEEALFMHQEDTFNYFENNELQLLEMKYKNSNLSMYIALPKNGHKITQSNFNNAVKNKKETLVNVCLPKFQEKTSLNLTDILKQSGITEAFKQTCTDFNSVMFSNIPKNISIYISDVLQETFLAVDEGGTEAAAATTVIINAKCCLPQPCLSFNANHPFTYIIADNTNSEILFMGEHMFSK